MRAYECLYIVHPAADAAELDGSAKKYGELIAGKGGAVRKADIWGKRQLAQPIRNIPEGNYILLRFDAPPEAINELEFRMRVDDRVLRYMTAYEIPEGAGQSDELMVLTERKERERRGRRGRGRDRGPRPDRRPHGDHRGGDHGDGPARADNERRPAQEEGGEQKPAAQAAGSDTAASDGGKD